MKVRGGYEQSYNAQAAVKTSSMLIVGKHLTDQANDKQQLAPNLAASSPAIGRLDEALLESGCYTETTEQQFKTENITPVLKRQRHGRGVAQFEVREDPLPPPPDAPVGERMAHL